MAVPAREGQTAAARAMAQEAAASLRTTAVESKMGIELGPDMLYGMRLVLLKLGDGALSQFGQKVLSALPLAYAACAIKEHSQMSSAERNKQMTKSLMSFAIPNFIVLVKAAAAQLDLPTPFDMEKKLYLTTLGTGKGKAKTWDEAPSAAWTKFTNSLKPAYTRDVQIKFDLGPQNECDFESGLNSKDYLDRIREEMWTESEESTKKAAAEATDLSPEAGVPGGAAASPGTMVGGTAAASALHDIRIACPVPGGGVAPGGGAATGGGGGGVGGGRVGGPTASAPWCVAHMEECKLRTIAVEGPNHGKVFWQCGHANNELCNFSVGVVGEVYDNLGDGNGSDGVAGGVLPTGAAGGGISDGVADGVDPTRAAGGGVLGGGAAAAAAGPSARKGTKSPRMPEGWIYPYILMAHAWSPWGGKTPGEWKHLCASGGKAGKRKMQDQIKVDADDVLASPEAMATGSGALSRVNENGDPSSRRQNKAKVKAEATLAKADKEKENMVMAKESMGIQKEGVAAMVVANANAKQIASDMHRMVKLREEETALKKEEAAANRRARKIAALERRNMMLGGKDAGILKQLEELLEEECNS